MDNKLKIDIKEAIRILLPYFKVTKEYFKKFKKPKIKRILNPLKYKEHPRDVTAYSPIENFFYFPLNMDFTKATINHEVGHYIHYQVNPSMLDGIYLFLRERKEPPGHTKLCELVAEYSNFILNLRTDKELFWVGDYIKEFYNQHGPEFLPYLSRITLEEAIKKGLIKI